MKVALLLVCLAFDGCFDSTPAPKPIAKKVKENRVPVHRFVLTKFNPGVAFDSQTGQLCKTWDWRLSGEATSDKEGFTPQRSLGEFSPTCLSLYQQYPSGVGTESEALSDE